MKRHALLFLGPADSPLLSWLRAQGEQVVQSSEKISPQFVEQAACDFLISYGYRHILRKEILDLFPDRAVNLHVSLLPWNRGADPNFWSFLERTPKGVTIHHIDQGIDTGDIIVQRQIHFDSATETLASSYEKLQCDIQQLFQQHWDEIKRQSLPRQKQPGTGTCHRLIDKQPLLHLLTEGWQTPVQVLEQYAERKARTS